MGNLGRQGPQQPPIHYSPAGGRHVAGHVTPAQPSGTSGWVGHMTWDVPMSLCSGTLVRICVEERPSLFAGFGAAETDAGADRKLRPREGEGRQHWRAQGRLW